MAKYSQTHLQLYQQMQNASYSDADLLLVDRAYRIAMRVFSGYYRPNNKPFLAHLVGVASILTQSNQPATVVAAGLLHSAYSLGLGNKGGRVNPEYRRVFTEALGRDTENLIYAYSSRRWSAHDFRLEFDANLLPGSAELQLYLIKIADVHEEFLDAGDWVQPRKKLFWDEETNVTWREDIAGLVSRFGYSQWANDFLRDATAKKNLPACIQGKSCSSFQLPPGLSTSRLKNRLIRWMSRR